MKTSENVAEEINVRRRDFRRFLKRSKISLVLDCRVFLDIFEIFAEDCFLLTRSFSEVFALWVVTLEPFPFCFAATTLGARRN